MVLAAALPGGGGESVQVTIGKKFFFFTAILLIVVLAATLTVLERQQVRQWEDHLHARSRSFARLATPELLKFFRGSFSPSRRLEDGKLREILAFNPDLVHFSLYSAGGRLLYESPPLGDEILPLKPLSAAEVERRVVGNLEMTLESLTLPQEGKFVDLVHPALGPTGEHVLSVRFLISYDGIAALQQATRSHFVRIALVSILTSLLLAALAARWISRPLRRLIHGARTIARGDLSFRLAISNRDELGTLAGAFNDMAASLSEKQRELVAKNLALEQSNRELNRAQESLVRAEKLAAVGQVAAGISHEIDNPVGIILGHAQLLREDMTPDDPRIEDVETIIAESRRCRRITGSLLGLARSGSSRMAPVDLSAVIGEVGRSLGVQKTFAEIQWSFDLPRTPVVVCGDEDQLRQVLVNLVLNAAQAMEGKGLLEISLREVEQGWTLQVDDDGPGIENVNLERIFDPFYSTKERGEGTGLGLAVSRKLVEEHGGRIHAGRHDGGGARFTIFLPAFPAGKKL